TVKQDVVADARKVLHAATQEHHDRMLLEVMSLTRDIADHLEAVREPYLRYLTQCRIRLLGRCGVNARAYTALRRRGLRGWRGVARLEWVTRLGNKLRDRQHHRLSLHSCLG